MRCFGLLALYVFSSSLIAQPYSSSNVFAHNDYVRTNPFYTAYDLMVGYIEADVFLENTNLMVAHHKHEIAPGKDLEKLYIQPLLEQVQKHNGLVYKDPERSLTLMIDLKTEGVTTLKAVVDLLNKYPALTRCPTLQFMISGSVPDPKVWKDYPEYIFFDGRPGIHYTDEQLERISMISTSFREHSAWRGEGPIKDEDRRKISVLVQAAHEKGKKFRFWATPDFPAAWQELMRLEMDVIVTDDVTALAKFLEKQTQR